MSNDLQATPCCRQLVRDHIPTNSRVREALVAAGFQAWRRLCHRCCRCARVAIRMPTLDRPKTLRHSAYSMAKAQSTSASAPHELAELRQEIASLNDHVRLLVDAIDEVREELSWLTRNGLPSREPLPPVPVLKQMALDPCADDWNERLVIERGDRSCNQPVTSIAAPETPDAARSSPLPPGRLF